MKALLVFTGALVLILAVAWYAHRCEWVHPTHTEADGLRKISFTASVLASELASMAKCGLGFL